MYYVERPYRKNLTSSGSIYMGGEKRAVTIKNMSITGALAELNAQHEDTRDIYKLLSTSTMIDVHLPEMYLVGDAEIVRVDMDSERTLIAMEFKRIGHKPLYERKSRRANLIASGRILLNGEYREFTTVNVSADGLMIFLAETIAVKKGLITVLDFGQLELDGQVKAIWANHTAEAGTMVGLQYMYVVNTAIDGIAALI